MKWWFVMDLKHNMLCEYGINERRCHISKMYLVPLLPSLHTIALASSIAGSASIFMPLCIVHLYIRHTVHTASIAHRMYERTNDRPNERMSEWTNDNTHNTSYFMYIHTYFYFECVFHFIRSFVPSFALLFTSSSSLLFLYFCVCIFFSHFISSLSHCLCHSLHLVSLHWDSFIINKRVQSIK